MSVGYSCGLLHGTACSSKDVAVDKERSKEFGNWPCMPDQVGVSIALCERLDCGGAPTLTRANPGQAGLCCVVDCVDGCWTGQTERAWQCTLHALQLLERETPLHCTRT